MKHNFDLTAEEQGIHDALIRGGYKSVPNLEEEKKRLQQIARNTLAKNKVITVRLPERNLIKIKAAAAREGLPYQTYITSLLHKHVR